MTYVPYHVMGLEFPNYKRTGNSEHVGDRRVCCPTQLMVVPDWGRCRCSLHPLSPNTYTDSRQMNDQFATLMKAYYLFSFFFSFHSHSHSILILFSFSFYSCSHSQCISLFILYQFSVIIQGSDPRDILMTDGVYRRHGTRHVRPHRTPQNGALTAEQEAENDQLSEVRGKLERKFGTQTSKFDIISKSFCNGEHRFNNEFTIGI